MRGGRALLSFVATWFCTSELEPAWDLRPTGWRISVVGDAPLDVEMRLAVPLEEMGDWTPGYTANRAVNAVPFVCAGRSGHPHHASTCPRSSPPCDGTGRPRRGGRRMRPLPELTPATEWFWTSGADGRLRIQGCTECRLPRPSARAHLPGLPEPGVGADGGLRPGHDHRLHGEPAPVAPDFAPPYVDRRGGPGRGPRGPAHHHDRGV